MPTIGNDIGDEGAKFVAEMIANNTSIKYLDIHSKTQILPT